MVSCDKLSLPDRPRQASELVSTLLDQHRGTAPARQYWRLHLAHDDFLSAAFERMDKNMDGRLDLAEMRLSLRAYGATATDAAELMARFDVDHNDFLDHDECEPSSNSPRTFLEADAARCGFFTGTSG